VQELFPNAQIFLSTHSPFVVGSVSDAWVYPLRLVDGHSVCDEPLPSKAGESYATILSEVFGVEQEFDVETEELFRRFHELKRQRLAGDDGVQRELDGLAQQLRTRSVETRDIVEHEMRQLARVLGTAA
jgi:predicted ATP-binding protein involved in virulence